MFAILTGPRSGSHLLMSLLNSHPELTVHDEILGNLRDKEDTPDFFELGEKEGCLISYNHFVDDAPMSLPPALRQRVLEHLKTVPVIHLTRGLEQRARSQCYYAMMQDVEPEAFWRANAIRDLTRVPPRPLKQSEVYAAMAAFVRIIEDVEGVVEAGRWLIVSYEWLTGDKELVELPCEMAAPICEFLDVEPMTLTAGYKKIRKPLQEA